MRHPSSINKLEPLPRWSSLKLYSRVSHESWLEQDCITYVCALTTLFRFCPQITFAGASDAAVINEWAGAHALPAVVTFTQVRYM